MLEVIFENDNGKKFTFGPRGNNWFGINIGDGVEVALGVSQGFAQIGGTVETQSVSGRYISVTGKIFGKIRDVKDHLRNICAPFASGRLVFQGAHFIRVFVKSAPTFSAVKNNGLFRMQFYAPFPFFSDVREKFYTIGETVPCFRFPVNYAKPHRFGTRDTKRYINVINGGDVRIPFRLTLKSKGLTTDPVITNLKSFAFLKFKGLLASGEYVTIYRDNSNVLRAELTAGNVVTDVIHRLDEESTLFELAPGDNLISANDNEGGAALVAGLSFHPAVGALYET